MAVAVRDRVAKLIQEGKTQEQAVAAKPTADFDAKVGNAAASADRCGDTGLYGAEAHERDAIKRNHEGHDDLEDHES